MSINFTKNIEQYTTVQRAAREKNFLELTSKKQLEAADVITAEELEFVQSIKGTFSFALHKGGRYMAVTLYKASNNERKYNFLVVDLQEKAIAEVDSIKQAKAEILELVAGTQEAEPAVEETEQATEEAVEEAAEQPVEQEELAETKPSRRRGKKNSIQEEALEA